MKKNNLNRWKQTKLKIYDISLPSSTDISKKCLAYIKGIEFPPQYLADILIDLADTIMTSYPEVKKNSFNLIFY